MTPEGLAYLNSVFRELNIPYEYGEWKTPPVPDTYWTGEYIEIPSVNEDGMEESSFILTGTTKGTLLGLETVKGSIKTYLGSTGLTDILDSGSGICISYDSAQPLPAVEYGVHRLQIMLNVKEWRVNNL